MAQKPSLIGSIVERKPKSSISSPTPKPSTSGKTGFPTVQHRSKSAFSRNREEQRKFGEARAKEVPTVLRAPSRTPFSPQPPTEDPNDWRESISRENAERVAAMSPEEIEEEKQHILERFGNNVGDILKRARLARERQKRLKDTDIAPRAIDMAEETQTQSQGYTSIVLNKGGCSLFFQNPCLSQRMREKVSREVRP